MSTHVTPSPEVPLGYFTDTDLAASSGLTVPTGARYARISCTGQAVRWRDDGTAPTASAGMPLPVGTEMVYAGPLSAIKFIEEVAGASLHVAFYG